MKLTYLYNIFMHCKDYQLHVVPFCVHNQQCIFIHLGQNFNTLVHITNTLAYSNKATLTSESLVLLANKCNTHRRTSFREYRIQKLKKNTYSPLFFFFYQQGIYCGIIRFHAGLIFVECLGTSHPRINSSTN